MSSKRNLKKKKVRRAAPALPRARVASAVKTMSAASGTARFAAGKALYATAERDAARVYPHFKAIAGLLESDSKIVRWEAIRIIGLLAAADREHKFDEYFDRYLALLRESDMVSAANAIWGLSRIAGARPDLTDRIVRAVLGVQDSTYKTAECRNVVIGKALDALKLLGPDVCRRREVTAFVRRQKENPRRAVARSAERMMAELA